ncbi:MAG: glutathione S-transferase N-terminal domain-containing protein [Casimicrobiaceae bacterium]
MIDLYYWPTPNGHKITIFLEETGLPYTIKPINISKGEQFAPEFLKIAPNNRIPAIVDHAPADGGAPLSLMESGAILEYLAAKTGQLMPQDFRGIWECRQWLHWQMGNLGPMNGQNHHFAHNAPEKLPYAIDRYVRETGRLYRVLDRRLADRPYIVGDYSIADILCYPWVLPERQSQDIDEFPHLKRWKADIRARPAVERAYALAQTINPKPAANDEAARRVLYGQSKDTVK